MGLVMINHQNLQGEEIPGSIIDGGSRVNVISPAMPLQLVIGGHAFEIAAIVLVLDSLGAYPILVGLPWLHSANMK